MASFAPLAFVRACRAPALCAGLLFVGACAGDSGVERSLDQFGATLAHTFDGAASESRSFELPVDGVIDVDVDTFGGDVVIRSGKDTGGIAEIGVEVVAAHGRDRKDEAASTLSEVNVTAEIRRGGTVPTLVVRATTSSKEPWFHRTDIEILLPEMRAVNVRTRAGKVYLFENRGGVDVHTTDGEIRVITPWTITDDVTLITRGADIIFRSYVGTCGLFDVDIVNGTVLTRIEAGDWRILDKRNDHDTLYARLGTCTNKLVMRTSDARVLISVMKQPMEFGTFFLEP